MFFPCFWAEIRLCLLRKASENFRQSTKATDLTQPLYHPGLLGSLTFFPIFLAIACTIDVILADDRKHLEKFGQRYLAMKN